MRSNDFSLGAIASHQKRQNSEKSYQLLVSLVLTIRSQNVNIEYVRLFFLALINLKRLFLLVFMHVISNKKLKEFYEIHPDAETPLDNWYRIAKSAEWKNLAEVHQVFPSADSAGNFTIFNIKGNTYRLIVSIDYARQLIYVKYVLTHAEYDKEKWKDDPYY